MIHGLGFVSCVVIGDILNRKRNCLTIISADGWCHIYCCLKNMEEDCTIIEQAHIPEETETVDGIVYSTQNLSLKDKNVQKMTIVDEKLQCIHIQRIPANSKVSE